jgi:hypothetical protein
VTPITTPHKTRLGVASEKTTFQLSRKAAAPKIMVRGRIVHTRSDKLLKPFTP